MDRTQKEKEIASLKEDFQGASAAILTRFTGTKVNTMTELREKLRQSGAKYKVLKNTLARRAVEGTNFESLKDHFKQPIGIVYAKDDPVAPAKIIKEYTGDETNPLEWVMGHMDGKVLSVDELKSLASLPGREELLAKLLGSMQAPAQNFVNVLSAVPRQMATVLAAVRDQKTE